MTKVALQGNALGTGSVTLSAPNTDSAIDFELPVTGTHLASAQADGMPLGPDGDPVVESGSNSDGEWVRWGDGTQHCQQSGLPSNGNIWVYPVAFTAVPIIVATPASGNLARASTVSSDPSATQVGVWAWTVSDGSSSGAVSNAHATGRWK